jgi:hypothetical protein
MVDNIQAKEGFWNLMSYGENTKEAQERLSNFIRTTIEEGGFARKVLTPQPVTVADCRRSMTEEEFTIVIDFPPDSGAGVFTFFGEGRWTTVKGKRAEVPFVTIATPWYQWHKRQFLMYPYSMEEYLRSTFGLRMETCEDWYLLTLTEQALQTYKTANIIKGVAVTQSGAASGVFDKEDMINLKKVLTRKMVGRTIVIPATNVMEMGLWNRYNVGNDQYNAADKAGEEAFLKDYYGLRWIRTIKEDLLAPGNIYLYGPTENVGRFYTFGGVDFMVERHRNYLSMACDEVMAMCIANYNALAKLELYSGASQALPTWENIHNLYTSSPMPQSSENFSGI